MDDVKAMTRAGETVGKAVGSGWLAVRRNAKRAGQAGADATIRAAHAADRKLTERGVAPQHLSEALAEGAEVARQEVAKTSRRARKKLARTAKHTRKELAKAAHQARKEAKKSKPAKQAKKSAKQAKADAKRLKASVTAEAAKMKGGDAPKRRRRWPKVLLVAVIAAGVAYVVRSRIATSEPAVPEPRQRADEPTESEAPPAEEPASDNGQRNGKPAETSTTKHG